MSNTTNLHRANANAASLSITDLFGVQARAMEAFVTGDKAKQNTVLMGRIAVAKHLLKIACSKYPEPATVLVAASLRVNDLWQNKRVPLLKAFDRVTREVEAEDPPAPDPDRVTISTKGIQRGDGPVEPFKKV